MGEGHLDTKLTWGQEGFYQISKEDLKGPANGAVGIKPKVQWGSEEGAKVVACLVKKTADHKCNQPKKETKWVEIRKAIGLV